MVPVSQLKPAASCGLSQVDALCSGSYSHGTSNLVGQVKEFPKKPVDAITIAMARINAALDRLEAAAVSKAAASGESVALEARIHDLQSARDALADRHREADERLAATIGRLEKLLAS